MWGFASNAVAGTSGLKNASNNYSDDEISENSGDEGFECPICWESFNIVENIPYVLWCGHTLCKNCVLGLQWAVVKLPTLPIQLPFFISCPWCNLLSFRLVYKGNLKFPRKNYFLLWMVESMNGDRVKSHSSVCGDHVPVSAWSWNRGWTTGQSSRANTTVAPCTHESDHNQESHPIHSNTERLHLSLRSRDVNKEGVSLSLPDVDDDQQVGQNQEL
ncbi:RING/U-box superfamily protein, partial [Tanacetum coccineum]